MLDWFIFSFHEHVNYHHTDHHHTDHHYTTDNNEDDNDYNAVANNYIYHHSINK
jgi:hypothetical protein